MFQCKVQGCDIKKHKAKGYCAFHYGRMLDGTPLDKPKRIANANTLCTVDGCKKAARARGWCNMHYMRWRIFEVMKIGSQKVGANTAAAKTGTKNPDGYVVRYEPSNQTAGPNGQVYQHRHVMSEALGRPLLSHESVHHLNGDRSDNRAENLELWSSSQPAGQSVQDKIKWAREILLLYGDG